ncbi:YhdP family protein [Roseicella frigidaeris]|uniref:YhdP central domain-containing protein n=1 Tax=Roseicella frigidaeris TaxID=2230885 RepID=A0A327M9N3_9PROT|nr:AsmA-like C-terminal region-containing protein [Roseicella frigidaeris]RAI60021.1 hypothetical protein DOO78_07225 [Roseicella frigidaeris]
MSGAPGQASPDPALRRQAFPHWGWRWTRRCAAGAIGLLFVALAGLGLLAWRLGERPLELPQLARRIEAAVNDRPDGLHLAIGRAAIAWEGFRGGTAAPLDIRLREVRLQGGDAEMALPEASIALSFRALLRGVLAPAVIELRRPRLHATLTDEGIALGLGTEAPGEEPPAGSPTGPPIGAPPGPRLAALLGPLLQPASDRDPLAALRRIRVNGGELVLADPRAGLTWTLLEPRIELRRAAAGGLSGEGEAVLRAGAVSVPVRLSGEAGGTPLRLAARLSLPALRPAALAGVWPPLAPLAALDAPVALSAQAEFDADARPDRMQARLEAGPGALVFGAGQRLPLAGLAAEVEGDSRSLAVREAVLRLPGRLGQPGPAVTAQGTVRQRDGAWQAALDLATGPLQAADLPTLWPPSLAPASRAGALAALPSGRLREARASLSLAVPASLDGMVLEAAQVEAGLAQAVVQLPQGGRLATESLDLAGHYAPGEAVLDRLQLRLPATGAAGGPAPSLAASGRAVLQDGRWRLGGEASLDALRAADLAAYWPAGVVPGARDWIVQNITAGRVRNGQWQAQAEMPETLDGLRLTGLSGRVEVSGATVHWLRPVPPAVGVSGTVEFAPTEITLRGRGARQAGADGRPGGIEVKDAVVRFLGLDTEPGAAEMTLQVAGPLPEIFTVLRQPRLKLFEKRKLEAQAVAGQAEAQLGIGFPLLHDLPMEMLRIRATGRVTEAKLLNALAERDLDRANFDIAVDTEGLKLNGQALLVGAPVRLGLEMDFRSGPPSQVTDRGTLAGRFEAPQVKALGVETGPVLGGVVALDAKYEKRRNGQGSVALRGDLRDARLELEALRWRKPPGTAGLFEGTLRLQGETLASMEAMRLETLDLALRGRAEFGPRARLERVEVGEGSLGLTRFTGTVTRPQREGGPWQASLRGPLVDLRPVLGPDEAAPGAPSGPDEGGLPLQLDLRFDRGTMGEGRLLHDLQARLRNDAQGLLREARATGRTGAAAGQGGFDFTLAPQGQHRLLRLTASDGGALLQALDLTDSIRGGRLSVSASYGELRPGASLNGTAELENFVLRDAPALAKVLQAMTLYGLVEAVQGGNGLVFNRLVAPFALTPETLTLTDARAFSASLGLTAKGQIQRLRKTAAIEGTIVPAYVFNALLGRLPILGRLFSPEAGGGVFAATYRVQGPLADPSVSVNPLAALTPGFLRGLFGLGGAER